MLNCEDCPYLLAAAAVGLAVVGVIRWLSRDDRLPPGPRGVPILGYLPFIGPNMAETATKLSHEYKSDVVSLPLGQKIVVFLNSEKALREAFTSNLFPDRPDYAVKSIHKGRGLLSSEGALWQEQRRMTSSILRELGVGKLRSEDKTHEELRELISDLSARQGAPRDIKFLIRTAVTNVISALLFDRRYDYHDETFVKYFRVFHDSLKNLQLVMLLDFFPFLRVLPGDLFRYQRLVNNESVISAFFAGHVEGHVTTFDRNNNRDFIDAYIAQLPGCNLKDEDKKQLVQVIGDLFKAGGETVSGTILWAILYMAAFPEIQEKVKDDLEKVTNMAELPGLADKKHLTYTQAVLLEVQRFSAVSVIGTPHCNLRNDVTFRGFRIPAGTTIFGNQWALFRDEDVWPHPREFNPRNFLNGDGELCNQERLLNFGVGRRTCVGEGLAKMVLFLFFGALMKKFRFSLPEGGTEPDLDGVFTIIREPAPFELVITERK